MTRYAIGLDIGGTDLKVGLVSSAGRIVRSLDTPTGSGRKAVLANIDAAVTRLLKESGFSLSKIAGIGAGTPGLADAKGCVVTGASNLEGWNGTPLGEHLKKKFKRKVVVDNDVTVLALGESLFGSAKGFRTVVGLAFGTGLGGGIIIDGRIHRGKWGYAAEIGHLKVDSGRDAPPCTCGGRGCLETYASRVGIERLMRENASRFPVSCLRPGATPRDVYELAGKADPFASFIVSEVGWKLGVGLASLVNVFDPDALILGGGLVNAGRIFFDSFRESYEREIMSFYREHPVPILKTKFGREGGIVGSASLILQDYLDR